MAGALPLSPTSLPEPTRRGHPVWRRLLIGGTIVFLTLFILVPVANVFTQALSKGVAGYVAVFDATGQGPVPSGLVERRKVAARRAQTEKTWSAIRMSVGVAAVVVPLNVLFGLVAAWAVTKFRFRGRLLLVALIDLPFSVSPVVAGLIFVLLYGRTGLFGAWATNLQWPDPLSLASVVGPDGGWHLAFTRWNAGIIFTPLAIVLASLFVTFPFVARAVIPLMEVQGSDEEVAALSLGARGWRTFSRVTLPNIRWALLYGVILCTARAFGEFGAVSVVSGNTDANDTMPLRIEKLWNEYDNQAAFTVASLLVGLALVTLVLKTIIDLRTARAGQRTGAQPLPVLERRR